MESKIISDTIDIGGNIRSLRIAKGIKQTELVAMVQLKDVKLTRETLVKIESGRQHIKVSQLNAIRECLGVRYEEILNK
ncbi:helix-turn-helix domain-containing protein [Anaerosporobacter faecicola]|uniref:helix-turn-helix domain-containing protein n=1 Tax=Anaerosporobacter faecicola TaxID=2718714 RepID=UPI00143C5565|nr:helix-turn-helix transcriptional regulator [Anaerosporobacter faecicola]